MKMGSESRRRIGNRKKDSDPIFKCIVAFAAAALVACASTPATHTGEAPTALMSFNVRTSSADDGENAWPLRREQAARTVISREPDFVGLQEVQPDQLLFFAAALYGYRHVGRSREAERGSGEAVPLFYHAGRWAIDESETGTFWLSDTPDVPGSRSWGNYFPRIVTWARLVHRETGRAFYVYNLHLDHESENARARSSELLRRRIGERRHDDPVIVMGDFNAEPSSAVLQALTGDGALVDTFAAAAANAGGATGTFHEFTGARDGRRIDFILVSSDIQVQDAAILHDEDDGRYPSDHFPVTATIGF